MKTSKKRILAFVCAVCAPVSYTHLHDFRWLHGLFCSPRGGRRALVTLAETLVLHKPGWGRSHMTPAKLPRDGFPARWHDPYTDQDREEDPAQLADRAAKDVYKRQAGAHHSVVRKAGAAVVHHLARRTGPLFHQDL